MLHAISLGEKEFEVQYYHSVDDAENDLTNTQSIPVNYRNRIPDELLQAKVSQPNANCNSIAIVKFHVNKNILQWQKSMHECDHVNRKAAFDLEQKKDLIKKKFNLPLDLRLSFYSSEEDVFIGINELKEPFISVSKTVFLRAINGEGC